MSLVNSFVGLLEASSSAFKQGRVAKRARDIAFGLLTCYGRHTVTGMLTGCGKQFMDWSSTYRMFSQNRIDNGQLFQTVIGKVVENQAASSHVVAHMDDTLIRKRGRKIPGASWKRDPLGPPFRTNFVWGQRFLQISLSFTPANADCQSRALPVDFHHCPTAIKPKGNASEKDWQQYSQEQKGMKLSVQGANRIKLLRESLDRQDAHGKELIISVDGSYTNAEVIKQLPQRTTLIGRIRKDTKLFGVPGTGKGAGRKKVYGDRLPTPEQVRQDERMEWTKVRAWAAGKSHEFNVKTVKGLKWKCAGKDQLLQMVVIRPLGYRLTKGGKMLYRQPAYLICTDNQLDIQTLLQSYLWRWEIEVNFRDEKTILGCGQAQVRNVNAAQNLPAFSTAVYSLIHLAAYQSKLERNVNVLPKAKWDKVKDESRLSTSEIINLFRCEQWHTLNKTNFDGFVKNQNNTRSHQNETNPCMAAYFYTRK